MYVRWTERYTGVVHEEFYLNHETLEKRYQELKKNSLVATVEVTDHALYKH